MKQTQKKNMKSTGSLNKKVCQACRKRYGQYKNGNTIIPWVAKRDDWYWKDSCVLCPGELLPKHYHRAPFKKHVFTSSLFPSIPKYCPFLTEHLISLGDMEYGNECFKSV